MTLEEIAEEYLSRLRSDDSPDVEDYATRFPNLADDIRGTLPALAVMEQFGLESEQSDGHQTDWATPKVEQVGDYRILGVLGRGGMGIVYEAEQQSLRRRVALKVLPRMASDENGLARFQREARAAARLHHTNIVPVFQVGQDGEHAYYAMQLIEGQGLDAVIRDLRRLPRQPSSAGESEKLPKDAPSSGSSPSLKADQSEVLRGLADGSAQSVGSQRFYRSVAQIGLQAADALAYAHDRGIIHRDVKPSNLLLDASGVVWVSDFGLAMTNEGQLTRTEDVLGTLRYMSPERFQHQCDDRADIYALGVTLYELLVMEPAYGMVDRLHLVKSIMNDEPPTPRQYDPHVPRDLETIILKAIEKEPRDRYQSALAMADDLRRFLNDDPIQARRAQPLEKLVRWRRRNKSLAAALTAVAALLVLLIVVLSWTSYRQNDLRQLAEHRGNTLLHNLYFSQMNVAGQAATQRFGTDTIRAQLAEWDPEIAGRDLRNWEWYYLYGLSHGEEFASEPLGNGFCWACDHSPDGKRIVNTKNGWGVQVRDSRNGRVLAERYLMSARFVDWSPDQTKIAVGRFDDVCSVLDAKTLETIRDITIPSSGEGWCVRWHPNSTWLAEVSENVDAEKKLEIRIHDIDTGQQLWALENPEPGPRYLSWNPDGSKLASSGQGATAVWCFADGEPEIQLQVQGDSATWSPDGSMLAVSRPGGIWDALGGRQLAGSSGSIAWAPSSQKLAIGCGDGVIRIYDVARVGIHAQRVLRGHTSEIWSVSWNPDGEWVASCGLRDETVRTWKVSESDRLQFFSGKPGVHTPELSDDGTRIASSVHFHSSMFAWDLAGELQLSKQFESQLGAVAPSPNGKTIAFSTEEPSVFLWNTESDSVVEILSERRVFDLAWSKRGELAGSTHSGDIVVWDADGRVIQEIVAAHHGGKGIHWSPDGQRIVSCGNDSSIKVWNVKSGQAVWEARDLQRYANEVRFSNHGQLLASSHRNALVIWDAATGERVGTFEQIRENFISLDWSPDDSRLVSGSEASIAIWDVRTGKTALRLNGPSRLTRVRWTSDGMRLVAGGQSIFVYDASRGYALNKTE